MVKTDFAIGIRARLGSTRLPGKVLFLWEILHIIVYL